jgi:hypothetical protein
LVDRAILLTLSRIVVPHTLSRGPSQMFRLPFKIHRTERYSPNQPQSALPPRPRNRFYFP